MASGVVSEAIETFLTANWTATLLSLENNDFATNGDSLPPDTPAPIVEVSFSGRSYGQVSLGASVQSQNRWDEEGFLFLDVLVPINTGSSAGRNYAKAMADLFRGLTLLNGDLEFLDASLGGGSRSDKYNGNYFVLPVDIEWRRVEA